jgi:dihydroflavonol-4-reductase
LILPSEKNEDKGNIKYFAGDITKESSLEAVFQNTEGYEVIVIHAAGIISIEDEITPLLYNVNVNGTKNIIEQCLKYSVKRYLCEFSVHQYQR